ncbi:MAG: hypothetical protein ACXABY_05450 [Candidatus Thorarchaeota archaeon]|jgi:hypothetical protein
MPLLGNVRYRWKTLKSGKKIRLAFRGNTVIETKKPGESAKRVPLRERAKRRAGGK